MTGGRMAHPLLLSLANLDMSFRMKASNHAFLLLALLPVPKFIHRDSRMCGVLENRLIHECLDFVLQPVKTAARVGIMMSDPLGNLRYVFPALAAYIVDTPESAMLARVGGKTSSVTMATYKQFGDAFRHEPRTASTTLAQLRSLEQVVEPWDLEEYTNLAFDKYRLGGVHRPFWRDWPMAEPSQFLTPEPLHHWHRMFWDHDAKWCIHAVGSSEIDFCFSLLHPRTGFRHFNEGISRLKQVTGRDHRDVQRYIIAVIAGAVSKKFLIAVRSLLDFRYMAQATVITENLCDKINTSLLEFHNNKDAIIASGARTGKKRTVKRWEIPKLEFLQSVVPSIQGNGVPIQWSADITERAHITEIKNPSDSGNNQNYESQICRYLDRGDKCRRFDLATALHEAHVDFYDKDSAVEDNSDSDNDSDDEPQTLDTTASLLSAVKLPGRLVGVARKTGNYFRLSRELEQSLYPHAPRPFRTFVSAKTGIHLGRDPSFKQMSVKEVIAKYHLPDLHGALIDYLSHDQSGSRATGGRRVANSDTPLPLDLKALEVWTKLRIQNYAYHPPHDVLPAQTVNALPPSGSWPVGRCDSVILNTVKGGSWV